MLSKVEKEGLIKKYLKSGEPFVYARQKAITEAGATDLLSKPNDILAVEYIKALNKLNSPIKPLTITRLGNYDGNDIHIKNDIPFLSASAIRKKILNNEEFSQFIPKSTYDIYIKDKAKGLAPADIRNIERTILAFFRMSKDKDFSNIYSINEGIENRILKASGANSLEELYRQVKTKRYTMATVRRAVLSSFFGIKKALSVPQYIHVLAFNDIGRKLLKLMKSTGRLPIVNTLSSELKGEAEDFVKEECLAGDIFNLCTPVIGGVYSDYTQSPIYITNNYNNKTLR
jgi:predicted nucleotidyltransferase